MELTFTLMEINTKVNGIMMFKMGSEHTTIQTEIYIKDNGIMVNSMDKATIYIKVEGQFIKATGNKAKSKVLDNW